MGGEVGGDISEVDGGWDVRGCGWHRDKCSGVRWFVESSCLFLDYCGVMHSFMSRRTSLRADRYWEFGGVKTLVPSLWGMR